MSHYRNLERLHSYNPHNTDDSCDLKPLQEETCYHPKSNENPRQSSVVTVLPFETPNMRGQGSEDVFEVGRI